MSETYYIRMTLTEAEYAALHQRADVRQWPLTVTARAAMVLGLEIQRRAAAGDRVIMRSPGGTDETLVIGGVL